MKIRLGYLGYRGNRKKWRDFGCDLFGLQAIDTEEALLLRNDARTWRLSVAEEDGPAIRFIGLEVDNHADLDDLAQRLTEAGFKPQEDEALAQARSVSRLLRAYDPDGNPLEFYAGALVDPTAFVSPTGATFVTGNAGLGHILLSVANAEASLRFYMDVVGMKRSDILDMGGGIEGHFLNGGLRHHVIAIAQVPDLLGLHHIYIEVDSVLTVGRAWDRIREKRVPVISQIGQHANDPAFSFYVQSPSPFAFEYGTGSLTIDPDTWVETRWNTAFLWGGGPLEQQTGGDDE